MIFDTFCRFSTGVFFEMTHLVAIEKNARCAMWCVRMGVIYAADAKRDRSLVSDTYKEHMRKQI